MLSVYAKYIKKMSNENKTIHDFELKLICDFFSNMERQGPGSPDVTLKALSFIDNLTDKSLIADIGCGTGGQTMVLAGHIPGQITGLDLFPDFIDIFNRNAKQAGLAEGCVLFGGHAVAGAETFTFTVNIMYGGTYYGLVRFAIIMHQGLPDYLFLGDACFVTVLGKPCQ